MSTLIQYVSSQTCAIRLHMEHILSLYHKKEKGKENTIRLRCMYCALPGCSCFATYFVTVTEAYP